MFSLSQSRIWLVGLLLLVAACATDDNTPVSPGPDITQPQQIAQAMQLPPGATVSPIPFPAASNTDQPMGMATLSQRAYVPGSQVRLRLIGPKQATNQTALVQVIGADFYWRIPITFHNYQATVTLGLPAQFRQGNFQLQIAVQSATGQTSAPDTAFVTLNTTVPQPRLDGALIGVWEVTSIDQGINQQVQTGSIFVFAPEGQLIEGLFYLGCTPNTPGNACGLRCDNSPSFWSPGTPMIVSQGEANGTGAGFRHEIRRVYDGCTGMSPATGVPEAASYRVLNNGQTLEWTWPGAQTVTLQRLPG